MVKQFKSIHFNKDMQWLYDFLYRKQNLLNFSKHFRWPEKERWRQDYGELVTEEGEPVIDEEEFTLIKVKKKQQHQKQQQQPKQ